MSRIRFSLRLLVGMVWLGAMLLGVTAEAQQPVRFSHLTLDDGLSSNDIRVTLQDANGFLWIGTADGLNRYDGYGFAVFQYDPTDLGSITNNQVNALMESSEGALWVGTDNGLNKFDAGSASFARVGGVDETWLKNESVAALHQDLSGRVWVGHANAADSTVTGLSRVSATGQIEQLDEVTTAPVYAIVADTTGVVWLGTGDGLISVDPLTDEVTNYRHDPSDENSIASNDLRHLQIDQLGKLWIGTWGEGVDGFDPGSGVFDHHRSEAAGGDLASGFISALKHTDGALWIGTSGLSADQNALHFNDFKSFSIPRYTHDSFVPHSLSEGGVTAIVEDHALVLWVGTDGGGMNAFDQGSSPIPHFVSVPGNNQSLGSPMVTAIAEQAKIALWIGTDNGLDRFDEKSDESYTHFRSSNSGLSGDRVSSLAYSTDGYLWVGTDAGLDRYDPFDGAFEKYVPDPDDASGVAQGNITALLPDSSGGVWVGTDNGLDHIDNEFNLIGTYRFSPNDEASLSNNNITTLFASPVDPGAIWIGTIGGLNRLDLSSMSMTRYNANPRDENALSDSFVTSITARSDSAGAIWVGTLAGGLNRLLLGSGQFERYTRRDDAIPGNTVYSVVSDNDGDLWVATNWGLARFNPDQGTTYVYDVDRGVQSREFNIGAGFRTSAGELVFGGTNGFNFFSPLEFGSSPFAPRVMLTGYRIDGVPQDSARHALLLDDVINLGHDQNDVTFEFVGLHYSQSDQNRYRVRLRSTKVDSVEWRNLGTQRTASFANLSPGSYVFEVQAANADGVWNEVSATVNVRITPPWWQTWWFRIFAIIFVVGSTVLAYRYRIRRIAERNRELEGLVAERTDKLKQQTDELASKNGELKSTLDKLQSTQTQLVHAEKLASLGRLTAGVAHEIKNPLNFVNNFAQLSGELTDELRTELASSTDKPVADVMDEVEPILDDLALNNSKIAEHGKRADNIVKSMLLHARGSTGDTEMSSLHLLLDESIDLVVQGSSGSGGGGDGMQVVFERDYDPDVGEIPMVRQSVGRVFINLLENAFYAVSDAAPTTGRTPQITVRTMLEGNYVRATVEDNAGGIPDDVKARLFEPFFTTKPTGSGTGLGLSLAHDIIQSHNGTIGVEKTGPEGTVFSVRLPRFEQVEQGAD